MLTLNVRTATVAVILLNYLPISGHAWQSSMIREGEPLQYEGHDSDFSEGVKRTERLEIATKVYEREEIIVPYPEDSSVLLGEGFDLLKGIRRSAYCVTAGEATNIPFNNKRIDFSEVTDESDLTRKLNISASASGSYLGYSGGASYSQSLDTRTYSKDINIVARVSITSHATVMKTPIAQEYNENYPSRRIDIAPTALRALNENGGLEFRRLCGDGYISQIVYGSDLYGLYRFSNLDYYSKEKIESALNAAGPGGIFSAQATSSLETTLKETKTRIYIQAFERGGGAAELPGSLEDFRKYYGAFAIGAKGNERPLYIVVKPYRTLPSANSKSFVGISSDLESLTQRLQRTRSLIAVLDDAYQQALGSGAANYLVLPGIDTVASSMRSREGILETREFLKELSEVLTKRIAECISAEGLTSCRDVGDLLDNDVNEEISDSRIIIDPLDSLPVELDLRLPSFDLAYRALGPLPMNRVYPEHAEALINFSRQGGEKRIVAACGAAAIMYREMIDRTSAVRCETGDCLTELSLSKLRDLVYNGYGVSHQQCIIPPGEFPERNNSQELVTIEVEAGRVIGLRSEGDSKGEVLYSAILNCANGYRMSLVSSRGKVSKEEFFPAIPTNCNLEIRGFNSQRAFSIDEGSPVIASGDDGRDTYSIYYDDRTPGGYDWDDIIVHISITKEPVIPIGDY